VLAGSKGRARSRQESRHALAKDIRTWRGSAIVAGLLRELPAPATEREARRQATAAIRRTAQALGNTLSVCRKYYVHPLVIDLYARGALAARQRCFRPRLHSLLDADEQFLLHVLKRSERRPGTRGCLRPPR